MNTTIASACYAALRHGGAPPVDARAQLGLGRRVAFELELFFHGRFGGPMRPRFARHHRHVTAVLAEGGFPVMPERRP
ncbi:hypothetical protein [Phenylobacterium sp.]|jgi:hypothetical protein|uniref:hypothetical protein n=1 Tax=Phenylobacterium sp. TaxID=1871053 RepID=UPI002F94E533